MKIGIDARLFINEGYTGIARSVYEILRVWAEKFPEHDYYLFSNRPIKLGFELHENWHVVVKPWIVNKGKPWGWFELPKLIKEYRLDKFWGTNFILPRNIKGVDYYVTIYDLAALKFDDIGTRSIKNRLGIYAKKACYNAKKIIAISEASKADVVDLFGIAPEKIIVSYCGGMPTDYQKCNLDAGKVNPALIFEEPYFLFIGTIEPRKNIKTIIRGFESYIDKTNSSEKLVLAGRRGWNCDNIYAMVESSKYKDRIIMPGFISDDDKSYLLSNAEIFLYPSLYEGFGIPVLEAFSYNVPVITTKVSSLPEVAGNAAYYIDDPDSCDALARMIDSIKSSSEEDIQRRKEEMKTQMSKFSWEKNAAELISVFSEN